jgi:hypothetical protein
MESIMINSISQVTNQIGSWLKELQVKRFFAVVLLGFMLVTATVNPNVNTEGNNRALTNRVLDRAHRNDSDRPKTTGEWNRESREVEGEPGKRLERIGKESAEAVKDMGKIYPDTAKKSAKELKSQTNM